MLWTNGLFALNSVLWFHAGSALCGVVILATAIASALHHYFFEENTAAHVVDYLCACVSLVVTLCVAAPNMAPIEWGLVLLLLSLGLHLKGLAHQPEYEYDGFHTSWHVCVFAGQAILALSLI